MQHSFIIPQHNPFSFSSYRRFVGPALVTFTIVCVILLALALLLLGLVLELGALLAPWLLASGLVLLKVGMMVFLTFRLVLFLTRGVTVLCRRAVHWQWYQLLLPRVHGTLLLLWKLARLLFWQLMHLLFIMLFG